MTTKKARKIRVLVAKIGLDGHNRGAQVVAHAFRDAGMEVIYTGLHQTSEQVVKTAIEEDVDVVGISTLTAAHGTILPEVCRLLKEKGAGDKLVVAGGIIPADDIPALKQAGVAEVFRAHVKLPEIVEYVKTHARR